MEKLEMIKKLEYLIAFQSDCLARGDWESFDRTENEIKKIEEDIIGKPENIS
jgi:hypothetical protein